MQKEQPALSRRLAGFGLVFLAAYLLLFLSMSRKPGFYDESIVLTGAMRVAAGQVPHRDFYFIYGPAEIYILAGLFKVFGQFLLVERLFDLAIKASLIACVYLVVKQFCSRPVAGLAAMLTLLWIFGLSMFGYATTPVSLLNVIGCFVILPVFESQISPWRMAAAGAISGAAALFRYDTGIALAGIHGCALAVAIFLRYQGAGVRLRQFAAAAAPYLAGFLLIILPPAIYYVSVAPVSAFLHDVFLFPARYYRSGRHLPFPGIEFRNLDTIAVYLPIAIASVATWFAVKASLRKLLNPKQQGFLIIFALLMIVMYLKGLVRVSPIQMYLATLPSLLVMAILFDRRSEVNRWLRIAISSLMGLCVVTAVWTALHEIRRHQAWHDSVVQEFAFHHPPRVEIDWCELHNPLTKGICFVPEDDRIHAIEFIAGHTTPEQTLYSGVSHHDRIFANDNLIYFAAQRLPATRWSHFDPDLQNSYQVQTEMVSELKRNRPPYVVLDSEFDSLHEPNDSSKSSGVMVLDTYIHDAYQPGPVFGTMAIWKIR